jgi:hypothetical protein
MDNAYKLQPTRTMDDLYSTILVEDAGDAAQSDGRRTYYYWQL